jgi:hypothetical protein
VNPWGIYGIPAWMSVWAEILTAPVSTRPYTEDEIERSVSELREDLKVLTPDDLTIGRGRG